MESSARDPKSSESQPITSASSRPPRKPRQKKQPDSQHPSHPAPDPSSSRRPPARRLSPGESNHPCPSPALHPCPPLILMTSSSSVPKPSGVPRLRSVSCRTWPRSTAISRRALYDESQLSRQPFSLLPASLYLRLPRNTRHERRQRPSHLPPVLPHAPHRVPTSPTRICPISPVSTTDDDVRSSSPKHLPS